MDYTHLFLIPTLMILIVYIMNRFYFKDKPSIFFYIFVFLSLVLLQFIFPSKAQADEPMEEYPIGHELYIAPEVYLFKDFKMTSLHFKTKKFLTYEEKIHYGDLIAYHLQKGKDAYDLANKYSLLIPNYSASQYSDSLFKAFLTGVVSGRGNLAASAVYSLSEALIEYGVCVYSNWNSINTLLDHSKWHFETANWYQQQMKNG